MSTHEKLAELIAEELFVNGAGETAARLVMVDADERDLGGWNRRAVEHVVARVLLANQEADRKRR